ncbi:hypothetical protein M409DRAFT_19031 [Zasmidium cellare ATCC 36951]|uniref:Heme haloperoxidase family profile domain-containing protein n=1 Tax=Zasmidium cellare ATCC 36951 TaxID=1080233 RepID=A0A6A6CXY5_ZASCE|nr:uncharacterized protein M409DRAFT_19031 [Zasmidium cellare ATCC 36951]KAF2171058.1 hypothetical protein M409DRAFT_19031 [Zasmidium cellare ATCC 36951]
MYAPGGLLFSITAWCSLGQQVIAFSNLQNLPHSYLHGTHAPEKRLLVNGLDKPIDVSGEHAFQPPTESDQRGPCPGLNALANHNYISHAGIASLLEAATAINTVYGMGIEIATILSVMGVVWTGNPLSLNPSFSIDGNDTRIENLLDNVLGLLGTPQGISFSHNLIEADSSPTRDDLYVTGDPVTMNMDKFKALYEVADSEGVISMDALGGFAAKRFNESVATNPNFYFGPFTGMIARNAGYLFIGRLFANHTTEHPEGILTQDILKSFFAVSGEPSNFTYKKGWERIPDNLYKIPVDWTLVQLNLDLVDWILQYPQLGSIGGNVGEVNTFAGISLADPVTGIANVTNLLEGNNLVCFALQVVKLAAPSYTNLFKTLAAPLELILNTLATPLLDLSCPSWTALQKGGKPLWEDMQDRVPGANSSAL